MTTQWRMLYTDAAEFPLAVELEERAVRAGIAITSIDGHGFDAIAQAGRGCDGVFAYRARIDRDLLDAVPRWRVVARIGTGYDLIDVDAARERGVLVTNVPDFCTEELSDMVMLFVLAFARRLPELQQGAQRRRWMPINELSPPPQRLTGKTLGVLGFGRSGKRTAEKARAFGMTSHIWVRTPRQLDSALGAQLVSFEEALQCDYVSLHLPLTPQTANLIDAAALARFKSTGVLINIARGGVVDTDALVQALDGGRIAGAGLDVVTPAPLPTDHRLWSFPNVILTSHSAGVSVESQRQAITEAIDDAAAVLSGQSPRNPVPELNSASRAMSTSAQQV